MTDKRLKVKLTVKGRTAVKEIKAAFDWWDAGNYNEVAVKRTWERDWVAIPKYSIDEIERDGGVKAITKNSDAGIESWELWEFSPAALDACFRANTKSLKEALDFVRGSTERAKSLID